MKIANHLYLNKLSHVFGLSKDEVKNSLLTKVETNKLKDEYLKNRSNYKKLKKSYIGLENFIPFLEFILGKYDDVKILFYMDGAIDFGAFSLNKNLLLNKIGEVVNIEAGIFRITSLDGKGNALIEIDRLNANYNFNVELEGIWAELY